MKKILGLICILCLISFSIVRAEESKYIKTDSFEIIENISSAREFVDAGANIYSNSNNIYYQYYFKEYWNTPTVYYGFLQDDKTLTLETAQSYGEYYYNYFYTDNDNIITIGTEKGNYYSSGFEDKYTTIVFVLDTKMNLLKKIELPIDFLFVTLGDYTRPWRFDNPNNVLEIQKYEDNYMILLKKNNFSLVNLSCTIGEIDSNFEFISTIDCNQENLSKFFPNIVYEYSNNLEKKVYLHEGDKLYIGDEHKLKFYEKEKLIKEIEFKEYEEISGIIKSKDKIITTKRIYIGEGYREGIDYKESDKYIDEILVYNEQGDLLQTISDNSAYIALREKDQNGSFMVLKRYTDGVCDVGTYARNYLTCENRLGFDVYSLEETNDEMTNDNKENVESTDKEETPNKNNSNESNKIPNPDTHDIAIISFVLLFIASLLFIIFRKKVDF